MPPATVGGLASTKLVVVGLAARLATGCLINRVVGGVTVLGGAITKFVVVTLLFKPVKDCIFL